MSTKIYDAYRLKDRERLWPVLREIRERAQQEVVTRLRAYYVTEMETLDPTCAAYTAARAEDPARNEVSLRLSIAQDKLEEGFRKACTNLRRDYFDPDVTLAVTEHPTGFYFRAFCDPMSVLGGSLDFLRTHPELEDFHYQNSTDRPEDVSPDAWDERRRIWDEMATPPSGGLFKDQLLLEISSWQSFWHLNPWHDLRLEFRTNPPVLPSREEVLARPLRKLSAFKEVTTKPGLITALTTEGAVVFVRRAKKRSQKKQWVTEIAGQTKVHGSLERATDWVYYSHLDPTWRARLDRWRKEARARQKEMKGRKKPRREHPLLA